MNAFYELVPANAWLRCSLVLTLRLVVLGLFWRWLLPWPAFKNRAGNLPARIVLLAQCTLLGLSLSLLSTLFLAEAGLYSPAMDWIVLGLLGLGGLATGRHLRKNRFCRANLWIHSPGIVFFALAIAILMHLPNCGEWIAGGWDPGVYQNQGIHVAKTGTFHPSALETHSSLTREEFNAFTRGDENYTESFAGIPMDPASRRFDPYFFRLTPSFVAMTARAGGLRAATRVNYLAGFLTLILFTAMLIAARSRPGHILFALLFFATHPIWLYHLHLPTTEMLHLVLLCSAGLLVAERTRSPSWLFPVILFLGIVNRISFLPFASVWIVILAWLDIEREDRRKMIRERGFQLLALVAAALYAWATCSITFVRIGHYVPKLVLTAIGFFLAAMLVDIFGRTLKSSTLFRKLAPFLVLASFIVAITTLLAVYLYQDSNLVMRGWGRVDRFVPLARKTVVRSSLVLHAMLVYAGVPLVISSLLGYGVFAWRAKSTPPSLKAIALFHLLVLAIIVFHARVVPIFYPWGTRRYMAYLIPAMAISSGFLFEVLRALASRLHKTAGVAICLLVLALVVSGIRRSGQALFCTEYDGLSTVLHRVSRQIEDDDVLLVDHSQWGTPLTFIYGKQVLNGQYFFERDRDHGIASMKTGLAALERLHREGKSIRFLTSTKTAALHVYPLEVKGASLDWSRDFISRRVIHSRRAIGYVTEPITNRFRLFTWHPPEND